LDRWVKRGIELCTAAGEKQIFGKPASRTILAMSETNPSACLPPVTPLRLPASFTPDPLPCFSQSFNRVALRIESALPFCIPKKHNETSVSSAQ
jgi:hypothetical protein